MKTGMELVKELRTGPHVYYSGRVTAANLLEAWLREADEELLRDISSEPEEGIVSSWVMWIRNKILGTYPGTTQSSGKPREEE